MQLTPVARRAAVAALAVVVLACGDDDEKPSLPADARVQLASRDVNVAVGDSLPLGATLVNAADRPITGFAIVYTVGPGTPFTASGAGTVRGVSPGAGWVRLSAGGRVLDSVQVSVVTHPAGTVDQAITLGARPYGAAVSRNGVVYVTRLDVAAVQRGTASPSALADSIRVGQIPNGVTFNADGSLAFVANQGSASISIIDVATRAVLVTPTVPGSPVSVTVAPNQARVWVGSDNGRVYAVDIASRTLIDSVSVGSGLTQRIVFARDGSRFWTADAFAGRVVEVNVAGRTVTRSYQVGGTPQDVAITRDETRLFVANEAGRIDVINLATSSIAPAVELGAGAFGIALSPDQQRLYVTILSPSTVRVFDATTLAPAGTITVGGFPRRVAFDRFGTRAVVASEGGSVTFIR